MPKNNITKEITSSYTHFEEFLSYLPDPIDKFLNDIPDALDTFKEMLLDPHISSKLEQLKDEVLSKDWYIEPFDNSEKAQKVAKFVEDILDDINIDNSFEHFLSCVEFGYSVSEIVWKIENGYYIPHIKEKPQDIFRFKTDGTLVYQSPQGDTPLKKDYKFLVFTWKDSPKNPYGTPVLAQCYWPWQFKKAGWRFWMTVAEKFGVPTVLALFDVETLTPEEAEERASFIANALSRIQSDAALGLGGVDKVEKLESKGTGEDFAKLIEACNSEISKAITGEILTSDKGNTGSYALAKVHNETLKKRGRKLAKKLAYTLRETLIKWIVELNFGKDAPVPFIKFDFSEIAEWDQVKDAIDRGIPVSKKAIYQQYNVPEPEDDNDAFLSPKLNKQAGGEGFSDFFTQMLTRMNLR